MATLLNRIILFGVILGFIGVIVVLVRLKTGPSFFEKSPSEPPPAIVPPASPTPKPEAKSNGEGPRPTAVSPGATEVAGVINDYRAKGCTNVLHKIVGVKGTTVWSPRFPDQKEAACLVVIAATGDPNKNLTVSIRTPLNEEVEDTTPVSVMDYIYCAKTPGPHSVNVISRTNDNYTFAAIDCPFAVAKELLKKKQSK